MVIPGLKEEMHNALPEFKKEEMEASAAVVVLGE